MKKKLLSLIFMFCMIIPCALFVGCTKDKEPTPQEPASVNEVKVLFSDDGKTLYRFAPDNDETEYTVPEGVTTIGATAFENCDNLTKVVLPTTLNYVLEGAFKECYNLTTVEINSDISIFEESFYNCGKLSTIDTSKIISCDYAHYAFYECRALTSVTIAKEVIILPEWIFAETFITTVDFEADSALAYIRKGAFAGSKLSSINIPESCGGIGESAFMNTHLTSVTIGKNIVDIGSNAFCYCKELLTVEFETGRTKKLTFNGYPFTSLEDGESVFAGCYKLKSVINYPMGDIVDYMFDSCWALESFTFSGEIFEGYSYIGEEVFCFCYKLKEINLPEYFGSIHTKALSVSSITTIYINHEFLCNLLEEAISVDFVYVKTGLPVSNSTYLLGNFTKQETSDKTGYDMYVRNAE